MQLSLSVSRVLAFTYMPLPRWESEFADGENLGKFSKILSLLSRAVYSPLCSIHLSLNHTSSLKRTLCPAFALGCSEV